MSARDSDVLAEAKIPEEMELPVEPVPNRYLKLKPYFAMAAAGLRLKEDASVTFSYSS